MTVKKAALLQVQPNDVTIQITLQEGKTCRFVYSDRNMAREHFEELQFRGVVGGVAIRNIEFDRAKTDEKR